MNSLNPNAYRHPHLPSPNLHLPPFSDADTLLVISFPLAFSGSPLKFWFSIIWVDTYILNFTLVRTGVQRLTFFSSYEPQNSSLSINSCSYNCYPWFWYPLVTPQSWSSFKTLNKAQKNACIQINPVFSGLLYESLTDIQLLDKWNELFF